MSARRLVFQDRFDGAGLDRDVWLPHYLPAWSSLAATAATYEIRDSCMVLSIREDQPLWCGDDHNPPLRVSGVQSGNHSGPVGSTVGQQPYHAGLTVKEAQKTFWGWTPDHGYIEVRCRAELDQRSMAAFWLVGLEETPEASAEICVVEVFGKDVVVGEAAAVGMGLHPFRDRSVVEDFEAVRLPIDVRELHTFAVDWTADRVEFFVDGAFVRRCPGPPAYPMQMMVAVFDFPNGPSRGFSPVFVVDHVLGFD